MPETDRPNAAEEPVVRVWLFTAGVDGSMIALFAILAAALGTLMVWAPGEPHLVAYLLIASPFLLSPLMIPPRATIGSDGVHVRSLTGRKFVPATDIRAVRYRPPRSPPRRTDLDLPAAILTLTTGSFTIVPRGGAPEARAVVARLERTIATRGAARPRDVLARRGRPIAAWREEVTRALRPGFRSAGLSLDEVRAVVDAPAATAEQRIGAALALRELEAADGRDRVRIAARSTAHPALRVALERIADADADAEEAAIAEALAAE